MPSHRERVVSAVFSRLGSISGATVLRNEALPVRVPEGGLIILRDGDPGEPEVTLNPRSEYYSHRIQIEAITAGDEVALDDLLVLIGQTLSADDTLGGLAEAQTILAPEVGATQVEGAATLRHAVVPVVVGYLVTGILVEE